MSSANNQQPSKTSTVLLVGFVAGTLDIIAACTQYYINNGKGPGNVLHYVASGVFGKKAFAGGMPMAAWGLFFHFVVTFGLTIFFFWLYLKIKWISKNIIAAGILYGIFAWVVTTRIIVPLSNTPPPLPFDLGKATIAILILILCIGLPIALIINRYHKKQLTDSRNAIIK